MQINSNPEPTSIDAGVIFGFTLGSGLEEVRAQLEKVGFNCVDVSIPDDGMLAFERADSPEDFNLLRLLAVNFDGAGRLEQVTCVFGGWHRLDIEEARPQGLALRDSILQILGPPAFVADSLPAWDRFWPRDHMYGDAPFNALWFPAGPREVEVKTIDELVAVETARNPRAIHAHIEDSRVQGARAVQLVVNAWR
jgi:hypothetical protein